MGVTRLAINRPIAIVMVVFALLALGIVSYFKLPAELNPKVDFGVISIVTTYPGTSPQEIETLITKPIEDSISGVSGLKQISSTSQGGVSSIQCQFFIGTDLDTASSDLRQKVDAARKLLPTDADSPSISKRDTAAQPVMYVTMVGGVSSRQLRVFADNIVTQSLEQAPDVAAVSVFGGDQREIRVSVKRDQLAGYGITIAQLATAIQNANRNISAGYIQTAGQYTSIRFIGELASVDELRNLDLTFPSPGANQNNGTTSTKVVHLRDLADVSDTTVERTTSSTINGKDTVTLAIQKTSDGNTLSACNGIKAQLKTLAVQLPKNIEFLITTDTSKNVQDNLKDVVVSLCLGALFAITIVYLFLHNFRATLIIAIAIPTCVIATFLPISALGFTLNTMTLLGLSLAIGILIDDSIVVIENIVRHLSLGESPREAAINGRAEIGLAALTLTAVDLVVFLPIASMGGIIGQFFRSFGIAISVAVSLSLFVSFTLTPMLASRWFRVGEKLESDGEGESGFFGWFDRGYTKFEHRYQSFLRRALRHPYFVTIAGFVVLVLVLRIIVPNLGFRFAPGQDQNQVAVTIEAPAGVSLAYTKGIADQTEALINGDPGVKKDIKYLLTSIGQSQGAGGNNGTQFANINVTLYDKAAPLDKVFALFGKKSSEPLRNESDADVAAKIRKLVSGIAGAKVQASEVNGFGGGGAPLSVDVTGPDFNQVLQAANKIKALAATIPGVYNADLTFKASQPELQIRLDRQRAANYGLTLQQVAGAVSQAYLGDISAKFRDPIDNEQYNIRVQLSDVNRNSIYDVGNTPVAYQNGAPVLLRDVANIVQDAGPTKIDRLDRQRKVSVTGYLLPGVQIGNIAGILTPKLAQMKSSGQLGSANFKFGGEAQSIGDEGPYLLSAIGLGIALSYMLMAALFNSIRLPLSVMLTLPQALVGALLALFIAKQPFSLIAAIGVIMLNGLAAKNAILLVDYTNTLRATGMGRIDALLKAAPIRLRPILMTSAAIICATLPTAIGLGRGSGFRQSLGIVVVGGVLVSTVLTLIVIPCSYDLLDDWRRPFTDIRTLINRLRGRPNVTPDPGTPSDSLNGHVAMPQPNGHVGGENGHLPTTNGHSDNGNNGDGAAKHAPANELANEEEPVS